MKVEIAGHRRCFSNRGASEVINGSVTTAFEVEISLRGVNGAVKGAVAADGRGGRVVPNCAEFWRGSLAAADLLKKAWQHKLHPVETHASRSKDCGRGSVRGPSRGTSGPLRCLIHRIAPARGGFPLPHPQSAPITRLACLLWMPPRNPLRGETRLSLSRPRCRFASLPRRLLPVLYA